jgi:hypothetical protein
VTDLGDHLHDIGISNEDNGEERHPERIVHFDYQSVDDALGNAEPEEQVNFQDAASAIKSIILWCCAPPTLTLVGARCAALIVLVRSN